MPDFPTPEVLYSGLFSALQHSRLWADDKSLADAIPKSSPADIMAAYQAEQGRPGFDLKAFFEAHFSLPESPSSGFKSDVNAGVAAHIEQLWEVLKRNADQGLEGSSLIPLPHPYIVPGGRFNEIYYWDSYFTMLGLAVSGRLDLIRSMLDNFAWLIDKLGFIPNGNRSYFTGRSQPPFFAAMVELLDDALPDENVLPHYLPQLLKEYQFWMRGKNDLSSSQVSIERVVKVVAGC
jgi:alpha,alpha-trehalase